MFIVSLDKTGLYVLGFQTLIMNNLLFFEYGPCSIKVEMGGEDERNNP